MFELEPFKVEHLIHWMKQPQNYFLRDWFERGIPQRLENGKTHFSGRVQGEVMVCGGFSEYWRGRCELWTVFNENSKQNFLPVYRGVKRWLNAIPCRRIEMSIPLNSPCLKVAIRRAELLGFQLEAAKMLKYFPDGEDACLYAYVKSEVN